MLGRKGGRGKSRGGRVVKIGELSKARAVGSRGLVRPAVVVATN